MFKVDPITSNEWLISHENVLIRITNRNIYNKLVFVTWYTVGYEDVNQVNMMINQRLKPLKVRFTHCFWFWNLCLFVMFIIKLEIMSGSTLYPGLFESAI